MGWEERAENALKQTEADSRVQEFEAKVAKHEGGAGRSALPARLDEFIDQRLEQLGRDARTYAVSQVEDEHETLRRTREIVESARAQADETVAKAEPEQDELSRPVDESRQQVDQFLQKCKVPAEEEARAA